MLGVGLSFLVVIRVSLLRTILTRIKRMILDPTWWLYVSGVIERTINDTVLITFRKGIGHDKNT